MPPNQIEIFFYLSSWEATCIMTIMFNICTWIHVGICVHVCTCFHISKPSQILKIVKYDVKTFLIIVIDVLFLLKVRGRRLNGRLYKFVCSICIDLCFSSVFFACLWLIYGCLLDSDKLEWQLIRLLQNWILKDFMCKLVLSLQPRGWDEEFHITLGPYPRSSYIIERDRVSTLML